MAERIMSEVEPEWMIAVAVAMLLPIIACSRRQDGTIRLATRAPDPPAAVADEPPVAVNPVSPVIYPPALLDQGIEGRVLLRLYADSSGQLIPDSSRVAESSGYPALDSAALAGAASLRFSPALQHGRRVAAPFLQPVQFQNPRSRTS